MGWVDRTRDAGRSLKDIELKDLQEQLDSVRDYLSNLATSTSKIANRHWRDTRGRALDTAQEAEQLMKENLAASLVLALGIGVLIGYLIRRGSA
jgi:ElaB/YqjD/DUF883 family membrane-anchored ribosome-binding protein